VPKYRNKLTKEIPLQYINYTVRSESRCALRLRYVVSIEVSVDITSNTFYKCTATFPTQICGKCLRVKLNGSGLYRRSWTSLLIPFISAQRLSERNVQRVRYELWPRNISGHYTRDSPFVTKIVDGALFFRRLQTEAAGDPVMQ
jgi:hypothetical protein